MSKKFRVEITDGKARTARVTDAETGETFSVLSAEISFDLSVSPLAVLTLKTYAFDATYTGPGRAFTLCPACKKDRGDARRTLDQYAR